ncbi:SDR family NAD(P)-dependent oxidoreductase [Spirosoma utsteinense]|uniref:NAD(P)-dependent dehydrogenase (Short-subunit alcohol dehydrogenase family) n=1 Tax=Spirosoma utsteinense TaxID=2585773 RepID=A0ABR6WD81_9BACT|nr:SDR family NAD(P)-dependent oxidoreductase [Spirosoma utsteinense]MBC3788425.1 NAD(P)-dependent dehydrogenase (short-subunit alcohol dehydrogenase family) [Spirosoma utsteinense]MBC3794484.1 NAD(P)-dependent dehydrogenase (short-subunit alcohol dehydrogenase family) [Spirosoma utsteinense]
MGTKTALITGANSGLGLATAKALAQRSFDLVLLCRSDQKGREAQADVQKANPAVTVDYFIADLADLDSVREAAGQITAKYPQLDVLINNAGYTPARLEFVDGIEKSFYASHIGHFVLTNHLLGSLKAAGAGANGPARVISLSSAAYLGGRAARFFRKIDDLSPTFAYCDDKLANLLFARELARQTAGQGVVSYSVHPGAVRTRFGADTPGFLGKVFSLAGPLMRTPEKGAQTSVFLASAPMKSIGERNNGGYFADSAPKNTHNRDINDEKAAWLWEKTMPFV